MEQWRGSTTRQVGLLVCCFMGAKQGEAGDGARVWQKLIQGGGSVLHHDTNTTITHFVVYIECTVLVSVV